MNTRSLRYLAIAFSLLVPLTSPAADDLPVVAPKIKTIAVFKNGLGFVFKSGETPLKEGWACIDSLPDAALGSFWIGTLGKSGPVTDAITCKQKISEDVEAASLDDLLTANVGKRVALTYLIGGESTRLEGVLVSVPSLKIPPRDFIQPGYSARILAVAEPTSTPGAIVLLRTTVQDKVTMRALNKGLIQSVELLENPVLTTKKESERLRLKLHVGGNPRSAEITMTYLEKGIVWSPSYRVNIANEKTAEISLDAVLANDVEDLENTDVSFVVGYPNFLYSDLLSPLSGRQSVAEFIQSFLAVRNGDFSSPLANVMSQSIRYEPRADAASGYSSKPLPGEANQDLFFYKKTGVTLKKGERARYEVFTASVPYEHIYQWDIPDSMNIDAWGRRRNDNSQETEDQVWHTIRLTNTTKQPWTTAPAFIVNGMQPTAQDVLRFVPPSGKNTVRLTVATDVRGEQSQVEESRVGVRLYSNDYQAVTVSGKLKVTNAKSTATHVRVVKPIVGEVLLAPEGAVAKKAFKLAAANPTSEIEWEFQLPPGAVKEMTYQYKVLID